MPTTPDTPEMEVLEVAPQIGHLEAQTRGEIDIQIATARRYPRSIKAFRDQALEAATLDEDTAASCFYALPRSGKTVEGPSARLAEIVASCWGHLRIDARVVGEDARFVTSRAVAWDTQANVAVAFEVRRRITDKSNRTFNDDMIGVTSNAASSIALRNAVFKVVPSPFWRPIYLACRKVAVGDAKTLTAKRTQVIERFAKMGVTAPMIFALLEVRGEEDITLEHLSTLIGIGTAIRDGDTTIDQAFGQAMHAGTPAAAAVPTVEQFVAELPPDEATAAAEIIHAAKLTPAQWKIAARKHAGKPADLVAELRGAAVTVPVASAAGVEPAVDVPALHHAPLPDAHGTRTVTAKVSEEQAHDQLAAERANVVGPRPVPAKPKPASSTQAAFL